MSQNQRDDRGDERRDVVRIFKAPEPWVDFVAERANCKHYVSEFQRVGMSLLSTVVEEYLFQPGTPSNHDFEASFLEWRDVTWRTITVPVARHAEVKRIADALALAVQDDPPSVLDVGPSRFVLSVKITRGEDDVKRMLAARGFPPDFLRSMTNFETFPAAGLGTIHSIEQGPGRLLAPIEESDKPGFKSREDAIATALQHGLRPPLEQVGEWFYGKDRLRPKAAHL